MRLNVLRSGDLDPRARLEIRELLVELAKMGKTIFLSTHILADVSEICTHIGIVEVSQIARIAGAGFTGGLVAFDHPTPQAV